MTALVPKAQGVRQRDEADDKLRKRFSFGESIVETTSKDIGNYLEQQARLDTPVTYGQVIKRFFDLPPLGPNWKSHPLCWLFGELDEEDHRNDLPFRTALVYAVDTTKPGNGFFKTITNLRGQTVLKSEEEKVWVAELDALRMHYVVKS